MNDLVITAQGQQLMARMIAGTSTATFTKIQTSDHDYSGATLEDLTSLSDVKQTALVSKVERTDTTLVEVMAAIDNALIETGYYVKALGLFAKDSDNVEILYAVSIDTTNPDYMPAYGGKTVTGISYRLNTKVDVSSQVTIEVNPAATPTIEQVDAIDVKIDTHAALSIYSENGVHGLRYYNDELAVYDTETHEWVAIETGGGGVSPSNVTGLSVKAGNTKLTVKWSDPGDTIIEGQTICTWAGTKLVMKAGAYPTSVKDGTVVVDNKVLDAYKTNGYEINGLTNGTTYYFQLFPYADTGAVNNNVANRITGTPQAYRTMTVTIDKTNSNPATCCSYADDAVGMTAGSSDWDDFFGEVPVLLNSSGTELGNLKVSDYSKYEDGTSAPITTVGNDVMVKFPKRGLKISTSGNTVSISMTDNPDAESDGFKYYAHSYGANNNCDAVYVGAYKGYVSSSKLYSSSGKTPTGNQTIGTFRTQAEARGSSYEQMTFYVRTFLVAAYLLKYKNLDSQTAVGRGYVDGNSAPTTTGQTNTKGLDWGESTGKYQSKCLGIEDLWGNMHEWFDGIFSNSTRNILTATTNSSMNDTGSGYTDQGQGATADIGNYMNEVQGTTEKGFVAKSVSGSATTYFCDYGSLYASKLSYGGGYYSNGDYAGVFRCNVSISASNAYATIGGRLIKFKVAS